MSNKPQTEFHDISAANCARRVRILRSQLTEKRFQIKSERICMLCKPTKFIENEILKPKRTRRRKAVRS